MVVVKASGTQMLIILLNLKMTHFCERRCQAKIVLHSNDTVLGYFEAFCN